MTLHCAWHCFRIAFSIIRLIKWFCSPRINPNVESDSDLLQVSNFIRIVKDPTPFRDMIIVKDISLLNNIYGPKTTV